ncbi:MAG: hypothetical protein ABI859_15635, partial [Pseudomonadota bacterium]
ASHVEQLNLEGAWIAGDVLHLLQRGHRGNVANAVIQLDLANALTSLLEDSPVSAPLHVQALSLGECRGVPLGFSDASGLPDGRWVFTAVAEDTDSAWDDGGFVGAAIGVAGPDLRLQFIRPVTPAVKIEGVDAREEAGILQLLLVSDADDPSTPAGLYSATLLQDW